MSRATFQRWDELLSLVDQALELPPEALDAWLEALPVDAELKQALVAALAHADTPHPLLDGKLSAAALLATDAAMAGRWVGRQIGRWRITSLLGQGGMATVFAAERAEPPMQHGALKLMQYGLFTEAERDRFRREQSILARLEHPGIARLIDVGFSEDGIPFLVMEPVSGVPVDHYVRAHGLRLRERVALIARAGEILAYAQHALVVHRDLKPEHIIVTEDGGLKLLDFGVARLIDNEHQTQSRMLFGTPRYAAPEQIAGGRVSTATDVYSLGRIAEELVRDCGRRVPRDLHAVLVKACAEAPAQRYPAAAELVADLRRWLRGRPVRARRIGAVAKSMRVLRRHWMPATAVAAVMLALLLGVLAARREAARADRAAQVAEVARQHADDALARERALNEFIIGLFEADIADVPRDQMPSVRQIVDAGIGQARDPDSGPADMRAEMLLTLARVVAARAHFDEASELISDATVLLQPVAAEFPELYAEALMTRTDVDGARHRFDEAGASARRAVAWTRRHLPGTRKDIEARRNLARVDLQLGKSQQARQVFEALDRELATRPELADIRLKVATDLAIVYANDGEMKRAAKAFETVLKIKRDTPGMATTSIVAAMFNLASARSLLGEFDASDQILDQARELATKVEAPALQARAALWQAKSDNARRRGRFDEAERLIEIAAQHWAKATQRDAESDWFLPLHRGIVRAAAGRVAAALVDFRVAEKRLDAARHPSKRIRTRLRQLQARLLCQSGDSRAGSALLGRLPKTATDDIPAQGWETREAVATCLFAAGRPNDALTWLGRGTLVEHPAVIGDSAIRSRRVLLRARVFMALGESSTASRDLDVADQCLDAIGVPPEHPLRGQIASARERLLALD